MSPTPTQVHGSDVLISRVEHLVALTLRIVTS